MTCPVSNTWLLIAALAVAAVGYYVATMVLLAKNRELKSIVRAAVAPRRDLTPDNITSLEVEALKSHSGSMFLYGPSRYFSYLRSLGIGMHRIEKS